MIVQPGQMKGEITKVIISVNGSERAQARGKNDRKPPEINDHIAIGCT